MPTEIHISATAPSGETFTIFRHAGGSFRCISSDGKPAHLSDAGVIVGIRRCLFLMEACTDAEEVLAILRTMGLPEFDYALLTATSANPRPPAGDRFSLLETSVARLRNLIPAIAALADRRTRAPLGSLAPHSAASPAPALYLRLLHGRTDPAADIEAWGSEGPVIGPLAYVHTTYMCDVKFAAPVDVIERFFPAVIADWRAREITSAAGPLCEWQFEILDDLIHYDGAFYGDWAVFASEAAVAS